MKKSFPGSLSTYAADSCRIFVSGNVLRFSHAKPWFFLFVSAFYEFFHLCRFTAWLCDPFLIFPEGKEPPRIITYLGTVLPFAALGLLIVYCLKDISVSNGCGIPELLAILVVIFLHKWKKNILVSIAGGTVFYMILVQTIFR